MTKPSPFFNSGPTAAADQLAILYLSRENLLPTILRTHDDQNQGYSEGKVTNTRFGSFPHSTLIGTPWGTQVRASIVDTGSRGRRDGQGKSKKRKREESEATKPAGDDADAVEPTREETTPSQQRETQVIQKAVKEAPSGFIHLLPPTPETWTQSLPHRTQVVYTPDYSYILHRLKARPGTRLIEAGAGSGSFTHAAARAVFNGYPTTPDDQRGKVYSYEFHAPRHETLSREVHDHGLDNIVEVTHRDVCAEGFALPSTSTTTSTASPPSSSLPSTSSTQPINATSIFLDLPAPWLALKHLTRSHPTHSSPLDPSAAVHICTFSPCIEQIQRTISTLRSLGWIDIELSHIEARKVEVLRQRVGVGEFGLRKGDARPGDVGESLGLLRGVEESTRRYHGEAHGGREGGGDNRGGGEGEGKGKGKGEGKGKGGKMNAKQARLEKNKAEIASRKIYKEGRLVTRSEPELKMHTSYLVFAVLPREWGEEDERRAREAWPERTVVGEGKGGKMSKKEKKRASQAMKAGESLKSAGDQAAEVQGEKAKVVDVKQEIPGIVESEDVKQEDDISMQDLKS